MAAAAIWTPPRLICAWSVAAPVVVRSCAVCGVWVPVWLIVAATGGQRDSRCRKSKRRSGPSKVILWMVAALWVVWMLVVLYGCKQAFTGTFRTPTPTPATSHHGERGGTVPEDR